MLRRVPAMLAQGHAGLLSALVVVSALDQRCVHDSGCKCSLALLKLPYSQWAALFPDRLTDCSMQPTDWSIKMNKKERRLAVATALHSAAADILVADNMKAGVSS